MTSHSSTHVQFKDDATRFIYTKIHESCVSVAIKLFTERRSFKYSEHYFIPLCNIRSFNKIQTYILQ